jgi:hypothetical protein
MRILVLGLLIALPGLFPADAQGVRVSSALTVGRLKYAGGGDWYNDPSAEVNLLNFVHRETGIDVNARYQAVEIAGDDLFAYPLVFLTGHGNIVLTDAEVRRLRTYLENGGFLYVDDDYGLDRAIRREMKKVFPGTEFTGIPFSHGIYHCRFDFPNGPPKTHEHDNKPPQGLGLFHNGRLVVYYTYESNPSDGWADPDVHNDPEAKREEALRFGTNIVVWALTH